MSPEAIIKRPMVTASPIEEIQISGTRLLSVYNYSWRPGVLPPFTSALMEAKVSLRLDTLQRLYIFHTSQWIQQISGSGPLYLNGTWSTSYPGGPLSIQSFYVRSFHLGCS
ncbi:hypothetical protein CK203_112155 [Vitis vinifera]|uniref:Uncharacterized protein n=1 Tax=Vitis vinifera TaxID=29760 RepID=A0A438CBV8_VITVI|nr:hypothetical protein CK203_112155 [Vitis vinifera]